VRWNGAHGERASHHADALEEEEEEEEEEFT